MKNIKIKYLSYLMGVFLINTGTKISLAAEEDYNKISSSLTTLYSKIDDIENSDSQNKKNGKREALRQEFLKLSHEFENS